MAGLGSPPAAEVAEAGIPGVHLGQALLRRAAWQVPHLLQGRSRRGQLWCLLSLLTETDSSPGHVGRVGFTTTTEERALAPDISAWCWSVPSSAHAGRVSPRFGGLSPAHLLTRRLHRALATSFSLRGEE